MAKNKKITAGELRQAVAEARDLFDTAMLFENGTITESQFKAEVDKLNAGNKAVNTPVPTKKVD